MPSAHVDTFARDHMPPKDQQPEFLFELPELQFPAQLCRLQYLYYLTIDSGHQSMDQFLK